MMRTLHWMVCYLSLHEDTWQSSSPGEKHEIAHADVKRSTRSLRLQMQILVRWARSYCTYTISESTSPEDKLRLPVQIRGVNTATIPVLHKASTVRITGACWMSQFQVGCLIASWVMM